MKLSKTSAQAALAMAYLVTNEDGERIVQARQVAEHLCIPTNSAVKILQSLAKHGLIKSRLGRRGGYRFEGDSSKVTLLEVVEAIDGPVIAEVPRVNSHKHLAPRIDVLQWVCGQVASGVREQLQKTTLADLAHRDQLQFLGSNR